MFQKIKYIFLFFLCYFDLTGQDLSFKKITTEQGLPSNEIYSLLTDKKGYIWGATDGGVFRYNGEKIKIYTTQDGLPDNSILNVYEDHIGRIWVSSFNGRIAYIENEKVHLIAANDSLSKPLQTSVVFSMQVAQDGSLWLGTLAMLLKISPENNYKNIEIIKGRNEGVIIKEIEKDKLVNSGQRVKEADYEHLPQDITVERKNKRPYTTQYNYNSLTAPTFRSTLLKNKNILFNQDNILFNIDETGKMEVKKMESTIYSIYETDEGIWVCTLRNGVYLFVNSDLNTIPKNYLSNYSIVSITKDFENGMWFGTLGRGLIYCPSIHVLQFGKENDLNEKIVALKNCNNTIYFISEHNSLYRLDSALKIKLVFKPEKKSISEQAEIIYHRKEIILANSGYAGKITDKSFQTFTLNAGKILLVGSNIIPLKNDSLLILAFGRLIVVEKNTFQKGYIAPSRGRSLAKDKNENIFIGTLNGLYQFKSEKFIAIKDSTNLLNIRINHILPVNDNLILSTSGKGLLIYNQISKKIIVINESKGLIDDLCSYAALENNEIWVATKKGLSRIVFKNKNFDDYSVINYDVTDGLISNEINNIDFRGNDAWIGTRNGLCVITDYKNSINSIKSKIYLEGLEINKKFKKFQTNSEIRLLYSENNLVFHLANLSYKNSAHNKYYLQLKGYDENFIYTSNSTIEYQNLPYGNYELIAYGLNNNGMKSETPISFPFYIAPPFWKTWWFIILEFSFLIGLIVLFIHFRLKQFREKEKERMEINKKIIEHKLLALRAQMNPHFIFNAINGIQRFILQNNSEEAYKYLAKFSKLIRTVLDNANEQFVSLENELETLKLYIELELFRFENKFDYSIKIAEPIDARTSLVPGMLIQPFVENAIWHGLMPLNDLRKGKLNISIFEQENYLIFQIEDNGIGRKRSTEQKQLETRKSLGIALSSNRLGLIDEQSSCKITDLYDKDGNSLGTLVEIKIPLNNLKEDE